VQAVYQFKNATSQNRYSAFDITDGNEEPDPLNERFGAHEERAEIETGKEIEEPAGLPDADANFCPYCGAKLKAGYRFCRHCGKSID
jgi:hypothetical protein